VLSAYYNDRYQLSEGFDFTGLWLAGDDFDGTTWVGTPTRGNSGDAERTLERWDAPTAPTSGGAYNGHTAPAFDGTQFMADFAYEPGSSDGFPGTNWLHYHWDRFHDFDEDSSGSTPMWDTYSFVTDEVEDQPDAPGEKTDFSIVVCVVPGTLPAPSGSGPEFDSGLLASADANFQITYTDSETNLVWQDVEAGYLYATCDPLTPSVPNLIEFRTNCPPSGHSYFTHGTFEMRVSTESTTGPWVTVSGVHFPVAESYPEALIIGGNFDVSDGVGPGPGVDFLGFVGDGLAWAIADKTMSDAEFLAFRTLLNARFGFTFPAS